MKIFIKGKAKAQRIRGMDEHFNAAFLKIYLFKPYRGLSILGSLGGLLPHPLAKKFTYIKRFVDTERLGDLDRFSFPNGLLVMPVEELK